MLSHFIDEEADILKAGGKWQASPRAQVSDSELRLSLATQPLLPVSQAHGFTPCPWPLTRWSCRSLETSAKAMLSLLFLQDGVPGTRNFLRAVCHTEVPRMCCQCLHASPQLWVFRDVDYLEKSQLDQSS